MSDPAESPRRVRIVVTLGPASRSRPILQQLIEAGMNVARLNLSHGTQEEHMETLRLLREVASSLRACVAVLLDLQGIKIRTGPIAAGSIDLKVGQPLTLTTRPVPGDPSSVSVTWADLPNQVQGGERILLDDGKLVLEVVESRGERGEVLTRVAVGGTLLPHKGINLPGVRIQGPALTTKDSEDLRFGLSQGVDAVAVSFVRRPDDLAAVRQEILEFEARLTRLPIIAKLERPEALDNLESILDVCDGVMVARGDLGVEMSPEFVPTAQKHIIQAANRKAKLVITATQMLDSMIHAPQPTRAECSDVANAVYDGTDAVMLSGETAVGEYPVESVRTMAAILQEAERHLGEWGRWQAPADYRQQDEALALAHAARELAHDREVAAIAVFTRTGRAARLVSKVRPDAPILAFTPEIATYRRMALMWGVIPCLVSPSDTVEEMLAHVEGSLIASSPIRPGQQVILVAGLPLPAQPPPNFVLLHTVGKR
jgi:pyruvate kinase